MTLVLANNATSRLAGAISATQTELAIEAGDGGKFPTPGVDEWYPLTLVKLEGGERVIEIVRCTARATNTMTVERGQEGTAARAFNAGDVVDLRMTKGAFDYLLEQVEEAKEGNFDSYEVNSIATDGEMDLSLANVFTVNTNAPRTLFFTNGPIAGRAAPAVVVVTGNTNTVTWPTEVEWSGGAAPILFDGWTMVAMAFDGSTWRGILSGGDS